MFYGWGSMVGRVCWNWPRIQTGFSSAKGRSRLGPIPGGKCLPGHLVKRPHIAAVVQRNSVQLDPRVGFEHLVRLESRAEGPSRRQRVPAAPKAPASVAGKWRARGRCGPRARRATRRVPAGCRDAGRIWRGVSPMSPAASGNAASRAPAARHPPRGASAARGGRAPSPPDSGR